MEYFTVENLVWALFFAIFAAILYTCMMQSCLASLAQKLLDKGADSEHSAVTLEDLGYKKGISSVVAGFFAENGNYISKSIVKIKKRNNSENELLFVEKEPVRYYIPAENNNKRLEKHINDKISPLKLAVLIALLVVMAFVAATVIDLLSSYASTLTENGPDKAIGVTEDETTLLEEQEQANKAEELEKKKQEELERIEKEAEEEIEAAEKAEQDTVLPENEAQTDNDMTEQES